MIRLLCVRSSRRAPYDAVLRGGPFAVPRSQVTGVLAVSWVYWARAMARTPGANPEGFCLDGALRTSQRVVTLSVFVGRPLAAAANKVCLPRAARRPAAWATRRTEGEENGRRTRRVPRITVPQPILPGLVCAPWL